ncbi:MAG TPA: TonB-dependent receptor [Flavitalea sp.]|nr:TonB-dependent receptor [Flavitalea sp.]
MSGLFQTLNQNIPNYKNREFPEGRIGGYLLRIVLFTILITASTQQGHTQTQIRGFIRDGNDKPISNATVILLNSLDSTEVTKAMANDKGVYVFSDIAMGDYTIKATAVGFEQKLSPMYRIISVKDDINAGILILELKGQQLNEVVIRAQKPLFEQKIDRTVINVKSSITSAGTTALDVLERSPGIVVNRQNNIISMAGKEGVMVMINGKINYMPVDAVVQMLAGINAANIEKIELISTPPASYDAEGNAGFINIVLANNPDMGFNGSISTTLGYGTGDRAAASGNFNYRKSKMNVYGDYSFSLDKMDQTFSFFRRVNRDGGKLLNSTVSERDTKQRNHLGRAGFDYQLNKKTMIAGLVGMYNNKWSMDALNNNTFSFNGIPDTSLRIFNEEINHWKHYMANISVQHELSADEKISANIDYLYYHDNNPVNYFNSFFDERDSIFLNEQTRSSKVTPIHIWVGSVDYSIKLNNKIKMEAGMKASLSTFKNNVLIEKLMQGFWVPDPSNSAQYTLNEDIASAYTSFNINPDNKTEIKAGLRYEYANSNLGTAQTKNIVDRQFGKLFPSIFLKRKINKTHAVGFSYSRRITRPTFNDMAPFVLFIDPTTFFSGNPALRPSIGDVVKADYTFKKYLFSVSYSHNKDAIARFQTKVDPATNKQVFAAENLSSVKSLAVTLSLPFTVTNWWSMQNNLSGSWQQVNSVHNNISLRIEQKSFKINSAQSFIFPKRYAFELSGFYQTAGMFGTARLGAFGMLNAGVQKNIGKGKLRFGIDDIFNSYKFETSVRVPQQNLDADANYKFTQRTYKLTYLRSFGNDKLKEKRNRTTASEEERQRVN